MTLIAEHIYSRGCLAQYNLNVNLQPPSQVPNMKHLSFPPGCFLGTPIEHRQGKYEDTDTANLYPFLVRT